MKKKKVVILVVVGVTCIIWGFITLFISSVKKDQREMNARMDVIVDDYTKFNSSLEKFNAKRDEIHQGFLDTIYYETLGTNDTEYKNKLYEYEKVVTDISKSTKKLREYCQDGVYYSQSDVNSKCNSFKQGYEEMMNTFVEDVNLYNSNLDQYNSWLDSEGKSDGVKLENYKTSKKYIDYNKDGKYAGKGELNEE